jgi:hypothetical protein
MSGITLAQAQQILDWLIEQKICDPAGNIGSVSIAGRSVSYRSAADLDEEIFRWQEIVTELQRRAAGMSRIGMKLAKFS